MNYRYGIDQVKPTYKGIFKRDWLLSKTRFGRKISFLFQTVTIAIM